MQACLINFEIIILNIYYENEEIIKKGVPQSANISKLEWICSKFQASWNMVGNTFFGEQLVGYSSPITPMLFTLLQFYQSHQWQMRC